MQRVILNGNHIHDNGMLSMCNAIEMGQFNPTVVKLAMN